MTSLGGGLKETLLTSGAHRYLCPHPTEQTGQEFPDAPVAQDTHGYAPYGAIRQLHGGHESGLGGEIGVAELENLAVVVVCDAFDGNTDVSCLIKKFLWESPSEQEQSRRVRHQLGDLTEGHGAGRITGAVDGHAIPCGGEGKDQSLCSVDHPF